MQDSMLFWVLLVPVLMLIFLLAMGAIAQVQEKFYFTALGLLLVTYIVTGKGLAYLGFGPIYISELVLLLGGFSLVLITLLRGRLYVGAVIHWNALILLFFMFWCALRTVPYISVYGMDALRDATMWGYALFAIIIAFLLTADGFKRLLNQYSYFLPWILLGLLVGIYLVKYTQLPAIPNSPVPIINVKGGDAGIHLAGIGAFLLLGLDRFYGVPYRRWQQWAMWMMWGIVWFVYGSITRGGMVAALVGLAVAFILRPTLKGWVKPAILLLVLLTALFIADTSGLSQVGSNQRRELSFEQIATNFTSIVGGNSRSDQEATIEWRLNWWERIVGYTFGGEYKWTGKGFGINVALSDGVYSDPNLPPNRHPHNYMMSILARSGVPGFFLLLLFFVTFGLRLFMATRREGYMGRTAVWLLAYWMAFLFDMQVDVLIENPMGGIWFWSLVGISWVFIYRMPKQQSLAPQSQPLPSSSLVAAQNIPAQAG
jgi:O-antigen ligase